MQNAFFVFVLLATSWLYQIPCLVAHQTVENLRIVILNFRNWLARILRSNFGRGA